MSSVWEIYNHAQAPSYRAISSVQE